MFFQLGRIQVAGDWIDIDKDRLRTEVDDDFSRGRFAALFRAGSAAQVA